MNEFVNLEELEENESSQITARIIEGLRIKGWKEKDINDFLLYIYSEEGENN